MSETLPNTRERQRREGFLRTLAEVKSSPYEIIDGEKVYDVLDMGVSCKISESQLNELVESEREWFEPLVNKITKEKQND